MWDIRGRVDCWDEAVRLVLVSAFDGLGNVFDVGRTGSANRLRGGFTPLNSRNCVCC